MPGSARQHVALRNDALPLRQPGPLNEALPLRQPGPPNEALPLRRPKQAVVRKLGDAC